MLLSNGCSKAKKNLRENITTWEYTSIVRSTLLLGRRGGLGACPHRKIRLNLEAILANNFMLLSMLTYKECSIIHVIKALNLRIIVCSWRIISKNKLGRSYISKAVACMIDLFSRAFS